MNSSIFDILLIVIIITSTLVAYFKGFVKIAFRYVSILLSTVIAYIFSLTIASWLYSALGISNKIYTSCTEYLNERVALMGSNVSDTLNSLSGVEILDNLGFIGKLLHLKSDSITSLLTSQNVTIDGIARYVTTMAQPIIITVMRAIVFIIVIIIVSILCGVFANGLTNALNRVNIIGSTNRVLGGAIGLITGCVIVIVLVMLIVFFITVTNDSFIISQHVLDNSFIMKLIEGIV